MKLRYYVLRRLLLIIPILIGLMTLIFFISHVIPGDPTLLLAGKLADRETRAHIRAEYGLDKPLYVQYSSYLIKLFHGDFGKSIHTQRPVIKDIIEFLPASIELIVTAMVMSIIVAIPLGVISATKKDKLPDHLSRLFAIGGTAMPNFWFAVLLQLSLAFALQLVPIAGRIDLNIALTRITGINILDSLLTGNLPALKSSILHIILPAIVLSYSSLAVLVRITRSSMLDVMGQDYIRTTKAFGFPTSIVIYKYALKNAMIPTITHIGMSFSYAFGGTVVIETIFGWPGIGMYITDSILHLDFPAIIGTVMVLSMIIIFTNLAVDIIYCLLDPRIRY